MAPAGVRIDRNRRVAFSFDGRTYRGFVGDTLASALLANGVRLVGRSFKLHRPRGIVSCGIEEPNALVDIIEAGHRRPNQRATVLEVYDGLVAEPVNCWPSLRHDFGAINNCLRDFLPAGFYYKTFKWPNWHLFEPAIRRMAGLGRGSREPDDDRHEEIGVSVDVVVVGGGASGLSAAIAACQGGMQVMLLTCSAELGGAAAWQADPQVASLITQARQIGIRILTRTAAFGLFDHNLITASEDLSAVNLSGGRQARLLSRLWRIRARIVIAATGAFERPMVFPDNDRPGIMLAGAADKYARAYGVVVGQRIAIATNSDHGYRVAQSLIRCGVDVGLIIDRRPDHLLESNVLSTLGEIPVRFESVITEVHGTQHIRGCTIDSVDPLPARRERIACDTILSAGGFAPAVHLHSQAGGRLRWLNESSMFVPDPVLPFLVSVGTCAGVFTPALAIAHAAAVGEAIARGAPVPPAPLEGAGRSLANTYMPRMRGKKQFVDLQNDVTSSDVALAARENYRSVEHLKRYTTTGMGTDQGKTSNINALVLMGELTARAPAAVGTTTFRPPFAPVPMGVIAGRRRGLLYRPCKTLPSQAWHEARGATFEEYGGWWRPAAYPTCGESIESAAQREVSATRTRAGIFDGSPLGKIEIFGPDSGRFLDLMYVGMMSTLAIGQARYGVLLNENGVVVDDGIVARMGEQLFWVNTSSAGAERTAAAFEEWLQCEFVDLKVLITPTTYRWANITVAGPRAWDWLARAGFDAEISPQRMPHMSMRASRIADMPIRVLRASFSGEQGFEINIAAGHAARLFHLLWTHAAEFDAVPYGVEALQIMRIEKGYIHIGTDTDGTTLPQDIGLGRRIERKQANFVGRRSLSRPAALDPDRLQLVGLIPLDRVSVIPVGAHIADVPPPTRSEGHVTSSAVSQQLGYPIALAMLSRGASRTGDRVRLHHLGAELAAEVVPLPFLDPQGERLNG